MSDSLLRQRRNLLIACILLWLLRYGGVTFTKLSFAGFDIEFARPHVITLSIWIAYFYFLYRYYLYFVSDGLHKLETAFIVSIDEKCSTPIKRIVLLKEPDYQVEPTHYLSAIRHRKWVFAGQKIIRNSKGDPERGVPFELPISPWQLIGPISHAVMSTCIRSSVVTDYLLPFAIAFFILWYCGSTDWSGSFLSILLPT